MFCGLLICSTCGAAVAQLTEALDLYSKLSDREIASSIPAGVNFSIILDRVSRAHPSLHP